MHKGDSAENVFDERLDKKRRIALILGIGLGLTFASFAVVASTVASAHECPPEGCVTEGRMTGGGRIGDPDYKVVTHGFELHCDINDLPNNLQVNWDGGNRFHLERLTSVECIDDPTIDPYPPEADFDLLEANGVGRYNGEDGARIFIVFTDAGEPGSDDSARISIRDADGVRVLNVLGNLEHGNHQAHK
jgi:hypothetical protein